MTQLSKNLVCILMRSGIQIWIESDRAASLKSQIETSKQSIFVNFNDQFINTADISGIFTADLMEDLTRRKNGEYKCRSNVWHPRNTKCDCEANAWQDQQFKKTDELLKGRI